MKMIEEILEDAILLSESERKRTFSYQANIFAQHLDELSQILHSNKKKIWREAIQAIQVVGYPRNASVILTVVDHLCDPNWPGWMVAVETLKLMNPKIVSPYIIEIILDHGRARKYWADDAESVCLALSYMGEQHILPCLPAISYLLASENTSNDLDFDFVLGVLDGIPGETYFYCIPVLLRIMQEYSRDDLRKHAQALLQKIPSDVLVSYERILKRDYH